MNSKALFILPVVILLCVGGRGGCATPSGFENRLYNVVTNHVTRYVTNYVDMVQVDTNRFTTNELGIAMPVVTNVVRQPVVQEFSRPEVELVAREDIKEWIRAGGAVASATGVPWGGLIAPVLIGIYGAWAHIRGNRKDKTAQVFAQGIQVFKEVVKASPGGEKLASDTMDILKSQQSAADVRTEAAIIVEKAVDKDAAKTSAELVMRPEVKKTPVASSEPKMRDI